MPATSCPDEECKERRTLNIPLSSLRNVQKVSSGRMLVRLSYEERTVRGSERGISGMNHEIIGQFLYIRDTLDTQVILVLQPENSLNFQNKIGTLTI